ncbi:ImmA/IrrE family metallo-endopeptidase [Microbacterium album]|uniref:IrrE N-terminal-like domain-containing protein n=1 Tax=Microbacterium album TaxID=2053191 RepID=A0A917MJZ9_9MICO|nr:ImmA/IrrE family metallo-endopeptidase [Microbacterium album]GGH33926.1 hypothetical protein GCM10010921_01230 [Microbacterium album]
MQQLLALADELGLTVIEHRGRKVGGYHDGSRTVRLNPHMPRRLARSVLAHELGHAVHGHTPTIFGPQHARQERAAFEWAARLLIDRDAFAEVERLRDGHSPSMAYDLDVTVEIVDAYKGMLLRLGDVVYERPKMGAGQWDHRENVAQAS